MLSNKRPGLSRQSTEVYEETKVQVIPRDSIHESKFEKFKQQSYVTPNMIGMQKQTAAVPQNSRHAMKFCLGEKDNKLLKREVKTSDHMDMYTSKVNHTNARVNLDMQSRRATGNPLLGYSSGTPGVMPQSSNLLIQKHGRDNLIRAPFLWQ